MRFQAALQGVNLDEELKQVDKTKAQAKEGWFRDLADYEHLSQEEREELTQKMMMQHQIMAKDLGQ